MSTTEVAVATKKRRWVVDARGDCSEQLLSPLTAHQRHQKYRIAIAKAVTVLEEHGFKLNSEPMQHGFNVIRKGIMIDVTLKDRKTSRVAYVTSYPGYAYSDETVGKAMDGQEIKKVGARVCFLSDELKSHHYLQIGLVAVSSATPVYVELPDDCADPERFCLKAIFATIADLATQIPSLKETGNVAREALNYDPATVEASTRFLKA